MGWEGKDSVRRTTYEKLIPRRGLYFRFRGYMLGLPTVEYTDTRRDKWMVQVQKEDDVYTSRVTAGQNELCDGTLARTPAMEGANK